MRLEWVIWWIFFAAVVLFILAGGYFLTCSTDPLGHIHEMCRHLPEVL